MKIIGVIILMSVVLCSCNNPDVSDHGKMVISIQTIADLMQKYLKEVNYNTSIKIESDVVIIYGKKGFSDDNKSNEILMNYLKHQFFKEGIDLKHKEYKILIKYPAEDYFFLLQQDMELLSKNEKYWDYLKYGISNFTVQDCVYFELTSELSREYSNFRFQGDLWDLITQLSDQNNKLNIDFLAFYNWSKQPYSESLKFDRSKLDYYFKDMNVKPSEVDDQLIDSLYKIDGYEAYFR